MPAIDQFYPVDCPFCKIANAYQPESKQVPTSADPIKVFPQCHLLLNTSHVMAFLDIMPISPGHVLLSPRKHFEKVSDMHTGPSSTSQEAEEARITAQRLGEYIPILSKALCAATGVEDWNVVQNNGIRAAQVVPHVHFHLIPRYQEGRLESEGKLGKVDVGALKSWRMFGRGQRDDLDDEEGAIIASNIRKELNKIIDVGDIHTKRSGKL